MYKTRGKPRDPWNRAALEQEKELASSIHIKPLYTRELLRKLQNVNQTARPTDEHIRRRLHFEEFRETYQQRFQKSQERGNTLKSQMLRDVNTWMENQIQTDSHYDVNLTNPINLHGRKKSRSGIRNNNASKPALVRAPLRSIKTVRVEVPTWTNQAVVAPPTRVGAGESILQRLRKLELARSYPNSVVEEGVQVDLMKELKETRAEIDVATSQLKQIQTMLSEKRALAVIKEDETQTTEQPRPPERMKTKWSITNSFPKEKNSGKSRLLAALKKVNSRIQRMQEQYFNGPHHRYKSLKQVTNNLADVDIIYKNKKFSSALNIDSTITVPKNENNKEISPVIKKYILQKLFQDDKTNTEILPQSPRRLSPRQLIPPLILEESDAEVLDNSSRISVILPPKSPKKTPKDIPKLSPKKKDGEGDNPSENVDFDSMLSSCLKDSIFKSEYLMKEFNLTKSDYLKIKNKRKFSGKKKTVHFLSPKIDERTPSPQDQRIKDVFSHALKHTLYTT